MHGLTFYWRFSCPPTLSGVRVELPPAY